MRKLQGRAVFGQRLLVAVFACVIGIIGGSVGAAAATFDFEANTTDNGTNITHTVSGVTVTISNTTGGVDIIAAGGFGGSSGNVAFVTGGTASATTISFSSAVDITSFHVGDGTGGINNKIVDFTVTDGSGNPTVQQSVADHVAGGVVTLNWTGVTSFTVDANNGTNLQPFFENIVFSPTPTNTAPSLGGTPADETALEDIASAIDLSAYTVSDADGDPITLSLVVDRGTLATVDGNGTTGGVTITGSGAASMTLQGTAANLNTYLNDPSKITYLTALNDLTTAMLTVTPNDGVADGSADTVSISVTNVNDAPSLTATGSNPTFTEGGGAQSVFNTVTTETGDLADRFAALTMTVSNASDGADDILNIDGADVGLNNGNSVTTAGYGLSVSVAVSGTTATVSFSGASLTNAQMQTLVDGLTYRNASAAPTTIGNRVITVTSVEDNGGTVNGGVNSASPYINSTVTVVSVDSAPTITPPSSPTVLRNSSANAISNDVQINDVDLLEEYVTLTATNGTIALDMTGLAVATNTDTVKTFQGTLAQVNTALDSLTFTPDTNFGGTATIKIEATEDASAPTTVNASETFSITVTGVGIVEVTVDLPNTSYWHPGEASVAENSITSGIFNLSNPTLLASSGTALSISANGATTALTLAELTALSGANKVIAGAQGALTLTGFNTTSGQVDWSYDPTGTRRDHTGVDYVVDSYAITAIDLDGETDSDTFDIAIVDTAPTAAADTYSFDLSGINPYVAGDVTTNDTTGADTAIYVTEASHNSTVFMSYDWDNNVRTGCSNPTNLAAFSYGSGCINPDGTYLYAPDSTNSVLLALTSGQRVIEEIDYLISDQDGDTSPTTLSIWIWGENDAPEITLPSTSPIFAKDTTDNALSDDLQIADVDNGDNQTVTLTATNGTFSLVANGATVSGTGVNVSSETVRGDLAQVNAVLDSLTFTPTSAFVGAASLRIQTADADFTADETLAITVVDADITPPVVVAIAQTGSPAANATSVDFSVDFDEGVENVSIDDFELTTKGTATGTVSTVSGASGDPITVTVNAISGEGTLRLDLKGSTDIADADANSPPAAFTGGDVHTVDTVAPVLSEVAAVQTPSNAAFPEVTFSSTEAGVISAVGGSCSTTSSGTVIVGNNIIALAETGTGTSLPEGTYSDCTITVSDGVNSSSPLVLSAFAINRTLPAVAISNAPTLINTGGAFDVTLTFSADVGPLSTTDFAVSNASADSVSTGTGKVFTATFTADGGGDVSITYQANQTQDDAGNFNLVSNMVTVTLDAVAPTASIAAITGPVRGAYEARITLSEESTDFTVDDLVLVNVDAVLTGAGTDYSATLTPKADGLISVAVAANSFADSAGNLNGAASNTVSANHEGTRPNVTLSGAPNAIRAGQSFDLTVTFDEAVTGFDQRDFDLTNATATLSGAGSDYTARISPDGHGDLSILVPENVARDAAHNGNTASNIVTVTYDDVAPTAHIAELMGPSGGVYTTTITLSEPSTDFALEDLDVVNATAQISGSGDSYTVSLTPASGGNISVTVKSDSFSDAVGNFNTAPSNTQTAIFDTTAPTVVLSDVPRTVGYMESFTLTVRFNEEVVSLAASDITADNATVDRISGSGAVFQASLTALGTGDVSVQIGAGVTHDLAGNPNEASNVVVIANDVPRETQENIAQFQLNRANALLANQPDLVGFARGGTGAGSFASSVSRAQGSIDYASSTKGAFWAHLKASKSFVDAGKGDYLFGAIGSHREIGEGLHGGVMLQFDHLDENNGANRTSGSGWMVGPYVFGKLQTQPIYFSASVLGGKTKNETSPFGTYTDSFDSARFLFTGDLSGEWVASDKLRLFPVFSASYLKDTQQAYTDGLSNLIPKQSVALAQLGLGLDFSYVVETSDGQLELNGGVTGLFSEVTGTGAAAIVDSTTEPRARAKLGLVYTTAAQTRIEVNSFLDGIGQPGFESYGMDFRIELQF